jgi:hypothetical protein
MQLPKDILDNLNLELSRHKDPAVLNWQLLRGNWTAQEGNKQSQIVEFKGGYVIAERKATSYGVGVDLH